MKSAGDVPKEPCDTNQADISTMTVKHVSKLRLTISKLLCVFLWFSILWASPLDYLFKHWQLMWWIYTRIMDHKWVWLAARRGINKNQWGVGNLWLNRIQNVLWLGSQNQPWNRTKPQQEDKNQEECKPGKRENSNRRKGRLRLRQKDWRSAVRKEPNAW